MAKPQDIPQDVWDASIRYKNSVDYGRMSACEFIARAIIAAKAQERAKVEAEMKALLADPAAVRLNWLRGGINASFIISAEREACAALIEANMLCGDDRNGSEVLLPRSNPGNKVGFAYAAAIRKRGEA